MFSSQSTFLTRPTALTEWRQNYKSLNNQESCNASQREDILLFAEDIIRPVCAEQFNTLRLEDIAMNNNTEDYFIPQKAPQIINFAVLNM